MANKYHIVKIDISSKQKYIFSSNRLQEIIGASKIIEFITEILGRDRLQRMSEEDSELAINEILEINKSALESISDFYDKQLKNHSFKNDVDQIDFFKKYKKEEYNPYSNVLFEAGGNSMYIFKTKEQAKKFNQHISEFVLKHFRGIELITVIQDYDPECNFIIDVFDEIEKKITDKKNKRANYINTFGLGFTELCPNTRNSAGYEVSYPADANTDLISKILSKESFDKKVFYNFLMTSAKYTSSGSIYNDALNPFNKGDSSNNSYKLTDETKYELSEKFKAFKNIRKSNQNDNPKNRVITTELDRLSGKKSTGSYIGVTCLDGNSMGVKVNNFKKEYFNVLDKLLNQENISDDYFKSFNQNNDSQENDSLNKILFGSSNNINKFEFDKDFNKEENKKSFMSTMYPNLDNQENLLEVHLRDESTFSKDKEIIRKTIKERNNLYLKDFIMFTMSIKKAYTEAFENLKLKVSNCEYDDEKSNFNDKVLPVVPIILAGDDISFISYGKYANRITKEYIQLLHEQKFITPEEYAYTENESNSDIRIDINKAIKKLYVCSGTAIVTRGYPFAQTVKIAGELEKSAKKKLTSIKNDPQYKDYDASLMDWEIVRGYTETKLESFRDLSFTKRPYLIEDNISENKNKYLILYKVDEPHKKKEKALVSINAFDEVYKNVIDERNSIHNNFLRASKQSIELTTLIGLKHSLKIKHDAKETTLDQIIGVDNSKKVMSDAIEIKGFYDYIEDSETNKNS